MLKQGPEIARARRERQKRKHESQEESRKKKKAKLQCEASGATIGSRNMSDPLFLPLEDASFNSPSTIHHPLSSGAGVPSGSSLPPPPPPSPLPPPPYRPSGLPERRRRLPARFRHHDPLPEIAPAPDECRRLRRVRLIVRDKLRTICNKFGLYRDYQHRPSYDPESSVPIDDLANHFPHDDNHLKEQIEPQNEQTNESPPWPFKSMAIHQLMTWMNTGGSAKTYTEVDRLARIISSPGFDANDLVGFNTKRESQRLDTAMSKDHPKTFINGFTKTSINIEVPSGQKDVPPEKFTVHGLLYRDLLDTIKSAFSQPLSLKFHLSPFKLFHTSDEHEEPTRVYSELYNSDTFIEEHDRVQRAEVPPDDPNCKRERVVAALMFWSDATQLANFGDAKLWPIYMFFGNLSKYVRSQPQSGACHHIAYIPSFPDIFCDFASHIHAKWKSQQKDITTHCRRELMHAIWSLLLTDEFVHAYKYGIVIRCADGIERRVYPRIFTYSADYPEKVLLANIRDKGICPCPRCLTPKSSFWRMGMKSDLRFRFQHLRTYLLHTVLKARKYIYNLGRPIKGKNVEDLLKGTSGVPTVNAFVSRIGQNFDPCSMLVIDLMHEFELGVWKALFTHLIRVLFASPNGSTLVQELNNRYRQVSPFGSSKTIRRFSNNAADMKKLAARDFEDLLQCAIPVFEGLLPEPHNTQIMKLLYRAAEWHALAKLRLHTDLTVDALKELSSELGNLLRSFRSMSAEFNTVELPREATARAKRQQAQSLNSQASAAPKKKTLNLETYKFHAMADYATTIPLFGPTDGYSTQLGEMCHQPVKQYYALTNKRDAASQIAQRHRRNAILSDSQFEDTSAETFIPELHHQISNRHDHRLELRPWLSSRPYDPAKKDFIRKLKEHLLRRCLQRPFDGDTDENFTDEQRNSVDILGNKIYQAKTMRINYTTYDVRRDSDLINSQQEGSFVMVYSPDAEDTHPYWYARVLGIFHAQIAIRGDDGTDIQDPQSMEFLWVRWLGMEPGYRSGKYLARLPKIGFVPEDDEMAFGFLEPQAIIRASHLIPQFSMGRTNNLLSTTAPTAARPRGESEDWTNYYVDIFVDRDMFMRYFGGGIGHLNGACVSQTGENKTLDDDPATELDDVSEEFQVANETEEALRASGITADGSDVEDERRDLDFDNIDGVQESDNDSDLDSHGCGDESEEEHEDDEYGEL